MIHEIINTFTSWELSEVDEVTGSIYNDVQTKVLQNQLSLCAREKLQLEFDPAHPEIFIQSEAFKRGQLELLEYLINTSQMHIDEVVRPPEDDEFKSPFGDIPVEE